MNKINIHNYEAYMLDKLEGTISPSDLEELNLFLAAHPHLKVDIIELEEVLLRPNTIEFSDKDSLRISPNSISHADKLMIGDIENTNSLKQKEELNFLLKRSSAARAEHELYKKSILQTDPIIYSKKKMLKKKTVFIAFLPDRKILALAASILLLALLFIGFSKLNAPPTTSGLTDNNEEPSEQLEKTPVQEEISIPEIPVKKEFNPSKWDKKEIVENHEKNIIIPRFPNIKHNESIKLDSSTSYKPIPPLKEQIVKNEIIMMDTLNQEGEVIQIEIEPEKELLASITPIVATNSIVKHRINNLETIAQLIDKKVVQKVLDRKYEDNKKRVLYKLRIGKLKITRSQKRRGV